MATVTITNLREVQNQIRKLGADVVRETGPILLEGGRVMRDSQRSHAPGLTGATRRAMFASLSRSRDGFPVVFAGLDIKKLNKRDKRGRIIRYPYMLENGSRPHRITAGEGKMLKIFGNRFIKEVQHPGFPALKWFAKGTRAGTYGTRKAVVEGLKRLMRAKGADEVGGE